jgi:hypothetical protein
MVQFKDGVDVTVTRQLEVCKPECGTCNCDPTVEEPEEDTGCCECGDDMVTVSTTKFLIVGIIIVIISLSLLVFDPLNLRAFFGEPIVNYINFKP